MGVSGLEAWQVKAVVLGLFIVLGDQSYFESLVNPVATVKWWNPVIGRVSRVVVLWKVG